MNSNYVAEIQSIFCVLSKFFFARPGNMLPWCKRGLRVQGNCSSDLMTWCTVLTVCVTLAEIAARFSFHCTVTAGRAARLFAPARASDSLKQDKK